MESQELKESQLLTLKIGSETNLATTTKIGGGLPSAYLLSLEEEDVRLQYKHLNLSYYDGSEIPEDS